MGYSTNRNRLIEMLPYLGTLISYQDTYWETARTKIEPKQLAYRLHEAFHIAKTYAQQFPELAAIADRIRIKVDGTRVTAKFVKATDIPMPSTGPADVASAVYEPSVYTIRDIQALWAKRQSSSVNIPMYVPDDEMLMSLYEWGCTQSPEVYLMPAAKALTLIEASDDLADVRWTPAELDLPLAPHPHPD
jgi:hypothetical protein